MSTTHKNEIIVPRTCGRPCTQWATALPGRIVALMDVQDTGEIALPGEEHLLPDTATVVSSGVSVFAPGDTIVCVPGSGMEHGDRRYLGVGWPWWTQVCGQVRGGEFLPAPGWVLARREKADYGPLHTDEWSDVVSVVSSCGDGLSDPLAGERTVLPFQGCDDHAAFYSLWNSERSDLVVFWGEIASRGWLRSLDGVHSKSIG